MTEALIKVSFALIPGVVAILAARLVVSGFITGEFPLRNHVYNRRTDPVPFWFGMALGLALACICFRTALGVLAG
jgi:hypothetical protein